MTTARRKSTTTTKKENTNMTTPARKRPPAKVTTASAHPLGHLVPPMWMKDEYVSREIDGIRDIDWLDYARTSKQNVLLYGPTGSAKTSCVYAYAAEKSIPVVYVACNGAIDPATMYCRVVMQSDGTFEYVPTDITVAFGNGPVIIYFDEINGLPARNALVLHGALDKRRDAQVMELNEVFHLHDECQIIGSYNPNYAGTKPLNEAFNNRFSVQLEFNYDPEVEAQLILGIPVLLDVATRLRNAWENGDIETPVGPNLLLEFEQIAWELGVEPAMGNFVRRFKSHEREPVNNALKHYKDIIIQQFESSQEG